MLNVVKRASMRVASREQSQLFRFSIQIKCLFLKLYFNFDFHSFTFFQGDTVQVNFTPDAQHTEKHYTVEGNGVVHYHLQIKYPLSRYHHFDNTCSLTILSRLKWTPFYYSCLSDNYLTYYMQWVIFKSILKTSNVFCFKLI